MLDDVLTGLRQGHREAADHARVGVQLLPEDGLGALLDAADDLVHVLRAGDRGAGEPHITGRPRAAGRHTTAQLEQRLGVGEHTGAGPVADGRLLFGDHQRGAHRARLPEAEQGGDAVRRSEGGVPRIHDQSRIGGLRRDLIDDGFERRLVEGLWNGDDGAHAGLSSPRR